MLNKIIEYGLYTLVFFLPIQTRWIIKAGETEYATYSLYGTDILLILVLLLFLFVIASDPAAAGLLAMTIRDKFKIQNLLIFGLSAMSFISVFLAADRLLAFYKLGWLVLGLGLFWLVVSANYDRLKLLYAILAGIFLQSSLAGWQFLTQSNFANKWLGLAFHSGAALGVSVIETVGADGVGERWLRSYGGFDHPNILGGVLATGILIILYLSLIGAPSEKSPASRAAALLKGAIIIFTAALFFSFSRAAWLALALGIGAMLVEAVMKKNYHAQKNILQAILISGSVFFILFFQFSNLVIVRISGGERLEVKSVNERVESIKNSWLIIKNNWATGAGLGNYVLALEGELPGWESFSYQPAHNVFLLVLSEIGVFGFIFFVGLIFVIASDQKERSLPDYVVRAGNLTNGKFGQKIIAREIASSPPAKFWQRASRNDSGAAIIIALIVLLSLDHWLWSLHFGVLFFWLVLGMTIGNEKIDKHLIM